MYWQIRLVLCRRWRSAAVSALRPTRYKIWLEISRSEGRASGARRRTAAAGARARAPRDKIATKIDLVNYNVKSYNINNDQDDADSDNNTGNNFYLSSR